jgi:hypothetical protein
MDAADTLGGGRVNAEPFSRVGLAGRVGALSAALDLLLQVVDELPIAVDPCHEIYIRHARQALEQSGVTAVTT